jgi:hypothetical protein
MPFQYACFISYPHGKGQLVKSFIAKLREALIDYLDPYLSSDQLVFLDEDRLKGGDLLDAKLAVELCNSACMILVFSPRYFDRTHPYCAREYRAMEKLEEERLARISNRPASGLIIPVIFRGDPAELPQLLKRRLYWDFSSYTLVDPEIANNREYASKIAKIAESIYQIHRKLDACRPHPCANCDQYELPSEQEIGAWLETVLSPPQPLPGRE